MAMPNQESRTERATLALTPTEKRAVQFVANVRQTTESDLLRTTLLADVVAEYDRLMAKLREEAA